MIPKPSFLHVFQKEFAIRVLTTHHQHHQQIVQNHPASKLYGPLLGYYWSKIILSEYYWTDNGPYSYVSWAPHLIRTLLVSISSMSANDSLIQMKTFCGFMFLCTNFISWMYSKPLANWTTPTIGEGIGPSTF